MSNNPNPLIPQGSLLEQKAKAKASLPVAFFIFLALHAVVLGGLLMVGCSKDDKSGLTAQHTNDVPANTLGPVDTNLYANTATNPPPYTPPPLSNLPPASNIVVAPPVDTNPPVVTPPVSTPTTPTGSATEHTVAKGDTYAVIAKKYGVTISGISKANPGVSSNKLKVGQKLQIPAPSEKAAGTVAKAGDATSPTASDAGTGETTAYTVKPGDTIIKIAKSHGTSAKAIRAANHLKTDRINVGQKLKVPAKTAVATAPDTSTSGAPVVPTKQ